MLIVQRYGYGFSRRNQEYNHNRQRAAPANDRVTTSTTVATTSPSQIPTYSFIPGIFFHLNQIEEWEKKHPDDIDKMPVQANVLHSEMLCAGESSSVCSKHKISNRQLSPLQHARHEDLLTHSKWRRANRCL